MMQFSISGPGLYDAQFVDRHEPDAEYADQLHGRTAAAHVAGRFLPLGLRRSAGQTCQTNCPRMDQLREIRTFGPGNRIGAMEW